jgi:hypothetical protein
MLIGRPLLQMSLIQIMIRLLHAWTVRKIAALLSVLDLVNGVENCTLSRVMTPRICAISAQK